MSEILQKASELKAAYQAAMLKIGKEELFPEFEKFLAANPTVECVRWNQYAPYFNDGEPCTFRVNEFTVQLTDGDETGGDRADGFYSTYDLERATDYVVQGTKKESDYRGGFRDVDNYVTVPIEPKSPEIAKALRELEALVSDEDILRSVFGDDCEVTVTREGFEIGEYEHD